MKTVIKWKKVKKSQKKSKNGLFLKKMENSQFFSVEKKSLRRSPFRFLKRHGNKHYANKVPI